MAEEKERSVEGISTEHINIVALGAGQSVGRSCVLVEIKNKYIMFDCGMHSALNPTCFSFTLFTFPYFQWDSKTVEGFPILVTLNIQYLVLS